MDDVSNFNVATFGFAVSLFVKEEGMLTLFPVNKYLKDTARGYLKKGSLYLHSRLHAKFYLESDDATPFGHESEHDQDFFLGQVEKNSDRVNHPEPKPDQGVEIMLAAKEGKFLKMCICDTDTCKEYTRLVPWEN